MGVMETLDYGLIVYLIIVSLGGAALLCSVKRYVRKVEDSRLERVDASNRFEAVQTKSSKSPSVPEYREMALDRVSSRYSNITRLLIYSVISGWGLALVIPFLSGVPAYVLSILGTGAAVLLGIAAKPLVENLIAGVVMSLSKPVHVGDTVVVDGEYGAVQDITIMHTVIKTWDWRRYVVSNSSMLNKEVMNHSLYDNYRWAHVEFWVAYDADLGKIRDIALAVASRSPHFSGYEPPRFWVMEMGKIALKCWVVAWAESPSDAWLLCNEIRTGLFEELQASDIKSHLYLHQWNGNPLESQRDPQESYAHQEVSNKVMDARR